MDWDHARIFLAVARSGQMLAAARKLALDHATISRRLTALETSLRTKLFERRTSGCLLTAAGEKFLEIAERVESEMLKAELAFGEADLTLSGAVRIGAPDGLGTYFLAPQLGSFALRHPDLLIQLAPLPRTFSLPRREADIAITLDRPRHGRLVAKKLTDYRLSAYVSQSHLAQFGPIGDVSDLEGRWLVTYVQDLVYSSALDYFSELGHRMPRRYECAGVVAQVEAVRSGVGIGVLHDYAARKYPDLVPVLPEISFQRTYWIVSHADVRNLRRVAEVYEFIKRCAQANRHLFL